MVALGPFPVLMEVYEGPICWWWWYVWFVNYSEVQRFTKPVSFFVSVWNNGIKTAAVGDSLKRKKRLFLFLCLFFLSQD